MSVVNDGWRPDYQAPSNQSETNTLARLNSVMCLSLRQSLVIVEYSSIVVLSFDYSLAGAYLV